MLYIGGTSLQDHYNNLRLGSEGNNYTYYKYQGIHRTPETILDGLTDEAWDVIMVQQVSGFSGIYSIIIEPYLQTFLTISMNIKQMMMQKLHLI